MSNDSGTQRKIILYQTTPQNITQPIKEIYRDGECGEEST
jgi:hypothetical protein